MRCWGVSRRLNAVEMERDALAFLASHYDGRHLDVEDRPSSGSATWRSV